jgi:hypothetical protein
VGSIRVSFSPFVLISIESASDAKQSTVVSGAVSSNDELELLRRRCAEYEQCMAEQTTQCSYWKRECELREKEAARLRLQLKELKAKHLDEWKHENEIIQYFHERVVRITLSMGS